MTTLVAAHPISPRPPSVHIAIADELYKAAGDLLNRCAACAAKKHAQAVMFDIMLSAYMPARDVGAINFRDDLVIDASGQVLGIRIKAKRVINRIAIDIAIPAELGMRIRRHLAEYRPHLEGANSDWLFPSSAGGPMAADRVGWEIRSALMARPC